MSALLRNVSIRHLLLSASLIILITMALGGLWRSSLTARLGELPNQLIVSATNNRSPCRSCVITPPRSSSS